MYRYDMSKKDDINKNYWKAQIENQLREEYKQYLTDEGQKAGSHSAHLSAIKKLSGEHDFHGYTERKIILLLAGELPFMYD